MKTILPISDLHSSKDIVSKLSAKFNGEHIDFITISGDVLEKNSDYNLTIFIEMLEAFPGAKIVFISGNHDYAPYKARINNLGLFKDVFYLENEIKTIDGVVFYGCPLSTPFLQWNYMKQDYQIAQVLESTMMGDIDVALFHQPPKGFGDTVTQRFVTGDPLGSDAILYAINKWQPKYAFFGHIHSADHTLTKINEITYGKNVSVVDEYYVINIDHIELIYMETE